MRRPVPGVGMGDMLQAREARHSLPTACLGACRMQVQPSQPLAQRPRVSCVPLELNTLFSLETGAGYYFRAFFFAPTL